MIRSLTGENSFALQRALRRYVDVFVVEHGEIALERLDGEVADYERIQASLHSVPFLAERKMVVLRSGNANKEFAERAEQLLAELPDTTDLIIVEPKVDKRSSYYKLLKKATVLEEFGAPDGQGLAQWLVQSAKEQGGKLSSADARLLIDYVGANQQLLASELEKLLTYNPEITRESIDLLVEPEPQSKVFDLLDAAFAGNRKRAIELYLEQREQKVDPSQIIAMLAWQLRILALILAAGNRSAADVAKEAKLNPYVVQKSYAIARRLSLARLRELITDLLTLDVRSKRENIDLDEALQNYLLMLAN